MQEGFSVVFEPEGSQFRGVVEPLLQLVCLDSSLAIKPVYTPMYISELYVDVG